MKIHQLLSVNPSKVNLDTVPSCPSWTSSNSGSFYSIIFLLFSSFTSYVEWKWKLLSSVRLFATPWTTQSTNFSRPGYWHEKLFPSPGDLPNPGIEPRCLALQVDSLPAEPQGKPRILEWVAYPFSSGSFRPRNRARVSCIAGGFFTNWAIREAVGWITGFNLVLSSHCNSHIFYLTS